MTHLAIFERPIRANGVVDLKDNVASCVTLMSQDRVPPGVNYNVS